MRFSLDVVFTKPCAWHEALFHLWNDCWVWQHVKNCFTKLTEWCFAFFMPSPEEACVAIWMYGIPAEQVGSVSHHPCYDGMFACKSDVVVVLQLGLQCSDLSHECSVKAFDAALCLWCVCWCLSNCDVSSHLSCCCSEKCYEVVLLIWLQDCAVEYSLYSATLHEECLYALDVILKVCCLAVDKNCHAHACFHVNACEDWCCFLFSKCFEETKVELYDWLFAVLSWVVVCSSFVLDTCWTPTPVGKVCEFMFSTLLCCWLLWCFDAFCCSGI